jgi:hypothetical protein
VSGAVIDLEQAGVLAASLGLVVSFEAVDD